MSRPRPIFPPAPPPAWQSEPVVTHEPSISDIPIFFGGAAAAAIFAVLAAFIIRRWWRTDDPRRKDRQLRNALVPVIGPEAAWLSASVLAERLDAASVPVDDPARVALKSLESLEVSRFGTSSSSPLE